MANAETPSRPRRTAKETRRLGEHIYERRVKEQVEADHHGEVVAIDVDSGEWAVAHTASAAAKLLRASSPRTIDVWLMRVGYKALRSFGAGSLSLHRSGWATP